MIFLQKTDFCHGWWKACEMYSAGRSIEYINVLAKNEKRDQPIYATGMRLACEAIMSDGNEVHRIGCTLGMTTVEMGDLIKETRYV